MQRDVRWQRLIAGVFVVRDCRTEQHVAAAAPKRSAPLNQGFNRTTRSLMPKHKESENQYRIKVSLKRRRSVWRSVLLHGDQTLDDLHYAIFVAFDRDDEHLYSFYFPSANARGSVQAGQQPTEYTSPQVFGDSKRSVFDGRYNAAGAKLDDLELEVAQTFEYLFDFGDEWWHHLKVEAIGPRESGEAYPQFVAQRGASPPQYPEDEE